MRLIVILGAGELGGALARQLAARDVASRIVLVDGTGTLAEGKTLDIRQAAPIDRYTTIVDGSTDESVVLGADLVILADRGSIATSALAAEWQDAAAVALVRRVAHLNPDAMLLCAGATHGDVIERTVRETGISRLRIVGSAPEALRSAVVSMTALEAECAPMDVSLTVVGRPPGHIIVPWEDASIGGRRAVEVLSPPAVTRLDARLSRLWPPGPLTLASAATRMVVAAATRGRTSLSAFVAITREEGDAGRVAMLPVTVSPRGVTSILAPSLSARDRVRLDTVLHR